MLVLDSMNYHEACSKQIFFRDCITFTNFVGFVVIHEYIENVHSLPSISEAERHAFYMFLLKLMQGVNSSIVSCLKDSRYMSPALLDAVLERFAKLRNLGELVNYVRLSNVKRALTQENTEIDNLTGISFNQVSLIGQFLRRFAIGFQLQTFEQTVSFCDKFFAYYDAVLSPNSQSHFSSPEVDDLFSSDHLSANQVTRFSENICEKIGQIGSLTSQEFNALTQKLRKFEKLYPDLPTPHIAAHLLAIRCRDFTRAETELYKAFEMHISENAVQAQGGQVEPTKELKLADAWTQMALAAVQMHHRFGHDQQVRTFQNQALRQALETGDGICLRQVKAAHAVINPINEPFRYATVEALNKGQVSTELLLTELRTKMLRLLDAGTPPHEVLLTFFNSEVASKTQALPIVLLDLALTIAHYGHPILATALLQCVIIADCLRPCPISDEVLSTSIAQLTRSFATSGSPAVAVAILDAADLIIGRFDEKSVFDRARLETQLEQALRMGCDLGQCDRLAHSLALFCPWEATVRRAEIELRRDNQPYAIRLLQTVANASAEIRNSLKVDVDASSLINNAMDSEWNESVGLGKATVTASDGVEDDEDGFLNRQRLPRLRRPPLGGMTALVRFELRARLAMADIFLPSGLLFQAEYQLRQVSSLASAFHLDLFHHISTLLLHAIATSAPSLVQQPTPSFEDIFRAVCGVGHQVEMGLRMRLMSLTAWASASQGSDGCREALPRWIDHLRHAACFYASIGNVRALHLTAALFTALRSSEGKVGDLDKSPLPKQPVEALLFPVSV